MNMRIVGGLVLQRVRPRRPTMRRARSCAQHLICNLLARDGDNTQLIANASDRALKTVIPDVLRWALSSDGEVLVTLPAGAHLQAYRTKTADKCRNVSLPATLDGPIAYPPNGAELLACCTADRTVFVFNMQAGIQRCVYQASEEVRCVAFPPEYLRHAGPRIISAAGVDF